MLRPLAAAALTGVIGLALVSVSVAQAPAGPPAASKSATAAAAGNYKLDLGHTSVIARVPHGNGFSYSTFRFGTVAGTLTWDPAKIENSKVDITLDPKSIMTPVPNFGTELGGERFLNVAKYPDAKFVSTGIKRTGPNTGQITGNLTFMGQTKPLTINAELVGAGKNMRGVSTVGFAGTAKMKRSDYGFTAMAPIIGDEVELVIDTEFNLAG